MLAVMGQLLAGLSVRRVRVDVTKTSDGPLLVVHQPDGDLGPVVRDRVTVRNVLKRYHRARVHTSLVCSGDRAGELKRGSVATFDVTIRGAGEQRLSFNIAGLKWRL